MVVGLGDALVVKEVLRARGGGGRGKGRRGKEGGRQEGVLCAFSKVWNRPSIGSASILSLTARHRPPLCCCPHSPKRDRRKGHAYLAPSLPVTHLKEPQLRPREDGPLFVPLTRRTLALLLLDRLLPPAAAEQATAAATAATAAAAGVAGGSDCRVEQLALIVRVAALADDSLVDLTRGRRGPGGGNEEEEMSETEKSETR